MLIRNTPRALSAPLFPPVGRHTSAGMRTVVAAFLAGVWLAADPARADDPLLPVLLTPGRVERFGWSEVFDFVTQTDKPDSARFVHYRAEAKVRITVLAETADGIDAELVYERIRFAAESPLMKEPPAFDTAEPPEVAANNPFALVLLPVVNKPIRLRLGSDGRIVEVLPPAVDIPDHPNAGVGRWFVTPDWVRTRLQPILSLGAPADAAPGAVWSTSHDLQAVRGLERDLRITTRHRAGETENGVVRVDLASSGELLPAGNNDAADMTLVECTGSGLAAWSRDEGILASYDAEVSWIVLTRPAEGLSARSESTMRTTLARLR